MDQTWVRNYIERYLHIHQCEFIEKAPTHLQVKLSVEVDKDLTNRPYYWTFVERTGVEPETMSMNFIFDSDKASELRGEVLKFGSRRLQQIFDSAKKRGKIVRLYQQVSNNFSNRKSRYQNVEILSLHPWLSVNYKIEFISDKKKDLFLSLGINLSNGKMRNNFLHFLNDIPLSPVLPGNVSTIPPFLNIREAGLQFEEWILGEIHKEDFNWARKAKQRLESELEQVEDFYHIATEIELQDSDDESSEDRELKLIEKNNRINELRWQYSPRIKVTPINYGIFYLRHTS